MNNHNAGILSVTIISKENTNLTMIVNIEIWKYVNFSIVTKSEMIENNTNFKNVIYLHQLNSNSSDEFMKENLLFIADLTNTMTVIESVIVNSFFQCNQINITNSVYFEIICHNSLPNAKQFEITGNNTVIQTQGSYVGELTLFDYQMSQILANRNVTRVSSVKDWCLSVIVVTKRNCKNNNFQNQPYLSTFSLACNISLVSLVCFKLCLLAFLW